MLLCLVEGAFSRLVLMRVYCRSGRLRCGRFWMAFQQRSKLGLKGQVVSRVTPSGVGSHTTTYVAREKAWILRATSSAFQYSAPMPPCRQRSPIICRKRTVPSYRHNTLSACTYRPSHSRPRRSTLCSTTHTSHNPLAQPQQPQLSAASPLLFLALY